MMCHDMEGMCSAPLCRFGEWIGTISYGVSLIGGLVNE